MVKDNYKNYDAFIVLHGTDTLSYTASALSFMLENLNKPVILTGSQIPILELKNDAVDNFLGSLLIAGQYQIPEVMIFFGNRLLRGNRSTKESTSQVIAFGSPNYSCLGNVGVDFKIHWDKILSHSFFGELTVFTEMSDDISLVNISPCINAKVVRSTMENSKAVII